MQEREQLVKYWESHSDKATVEGMHLDTEAVKFSDSDRDEILSLLPDYTVSSFLDLIVNI